MVLPITLRKGKQMTPSIKALETAFPGKGKQLRELLTSADAVRNHPAAIERERTAYHPHALSTLRLEALNAVLETYGVEHIPAGIGAKSPAIDYCNTGDTYAVTSLRVNGRYRIGSWGDIVERGNYD
jgi:hypothetical protein